MSKVKVSNGTDTYEIDGNDLPSAVKDGFKPTERIIVSNSKTKESYEIDPNDVKSALDEGFSFSDIVKKNGASGKFSQLQQPKEPELSQPTFKSAPITTGDREFNFSAPKEDMASSHEKNTIQANNRIKNHLQNIDESVHNLIYDYKNEMAGRLKSEQLAQHPGFEAAPINPQAQELESKTRENIQVHPDEIAQFKNDMNTNPVMLRQGLEQKAKDLTKTNPKAANQLKADVYRVDAQNRPDKENKISENVEKLNNGELDYDIKRGVLVKPEGFLGSLVTGYKQKVDAFKDYDLYKTGDEAAILKNLNKKLEQNPDEAIPIPTGASGEAGAMLGGQPLKPIAAGAIAGYFGGPEAGTAAMAATSVPEMYKLGFATALPQNYAAIKKRHPDISDHDALQQAIDLSHKQATADAATGAAMGVLGGKLAFAPTGLNAGILEKSVLSGLKQIGETATKKTLEGIGVGAIGGAGQVVKNIMAQKSGLPVDETEGVLDQIKGGALMTIGMHLAAKAPELLKGNTYNKIIHGLSKAPEEVINNHLEDLQKTGEITPEEAQKTKAAIQEEKNIDQSIKPDVSDEDRVKIKQKIKTRNALEKEMETSDKAFHPEDKEKIKKINEDIVNIANGSERSELQQLVDKSKIKGSTKEYLQGLDDKELNDAFKEIASQAHDPFSENQAIETFEEDIVNKAKELYPKEESKTDIISEHKPISENIVPNKEYQTMNMGKDEGKPETKEARTQMKERMLDGNIPMDGEGGKGETGKQFASRVLTEWEKTKNDEANNSTLVTHSSVLKAIKTWENPETWKGTEKPVNPAEMNDEQWKQFAEQFNKESTDNGDLETFKGKNGDIHVIRHGQTEDNKLNKFRSGNTNLTDEGIQQAHEVGQELKDKTNGEVPKIITSDLPRAVHTSNIIHENLKSNENASAIRSDTRQVQETGNAVEGSQNKSGENIQSPERQTSVDAKTEQQTGAKIEINTPEDFERELNKIFSNEPETKTEPQKTEPKKEKKKTTPTKEKTAKPTLSKTEQEMADYAYKNSYPYFKKEYPGIDIDEYNRLRSAKRQQGLPKLGEINQEDNVRPRNEDTSQYTPQSILDKAKAFYKNDPLINKVISFLEPIVKANPNIKIDTGFKWDSPEYQGQKITNQALGYSFPSGDIILNFDKIGDYDTLYRTGLHELMHAATRNEINTNAAFNGDLKKVLGDVRKAMGLPEGDSMVDALIRNKIISEDYDSRYGAANEHELLAEVFTNQKFFDYLKGLDYKGDNMLHRVFLAIAQFFSDKYKALVEAKSKISADNIADYLQQLTESVISKEQIEGKEGEALPQLRQSERDVLKNVIEKAIGKISDADIRGKLKQIANLTDPEIDDLLKEVQPPQPKQAPTRVLTQQEIGSTPEEPTRKSKLRQFQEKYFSRAKGLPDWMLALKDRAKGETHLEVRQALNLVNEVKKEAKRIGFNDWELFDKALRGQYYGSDLADLKALPPEMQVLNVQMRNKIDGLSRDLIINNYVTPEQALNIESNIGEYMTRSYKAFNEKNWGKKVPQQARDDAFRFLTQEKFNDVDPNLTDDEKIAWARNEANKELQSIIDGISDKYTPGKSNVEKGKDLGILKQRKDVPKEIRALLGEYTDPGVNFAMTIARIASLKSSAEYLTNLRQKGLGEIFFEGDNRPPEASVQIASEGSETWNPLNGLYTTPEVKEIFKESEYTRNWAVRTWLKTVGAIKWSKTVGSVVTQVKNFESNLGFSLMNGHFQAGKFAESYKFLKDKLFSGEKSTDQMIEKVIRLGLVDQSVGVRELRNMFENDKLDKIVANSSTTETSPIKKLSRVAGKGIGYLNKIYGASDDFWKVYGFLNEAESLSQATFNRSYKNLTENEKTSIDTEASERIKNTYPTYDRVWEGAKYVSKNLPIFGNFLSFQAESIRVLLNTFDYAMKDMKVPERRLMAARRLAGIGAYMGARTAILYTISQMTGVGMAGLLGMANDDDKDQKLKDINRYAPDFIRSGDKLAKDEGDGNYTVYDVGNLEPYGIWFKTMNAFQEGNQTVKEGGIGAAATELLSPFIEPEMSFKIGLDLYNNENDFGSRIYNPMDGFGNQMLDAMKYTLQKTKPSTIDFIQRVYSREDKQNEIAAAFGGRGYKVDVPKSFSFKLKAAEELFDANRDQLNKIKFSKDATDDEKNEAQKQYEERTTRIIKMLSEDYHAAIRLGAPMNKLDEAIDRKKFFQGYNKDVKNQIKSGVTEEEQSSGDDIKEWKP